MGGIIDKSFIFNNGDSIVIGENALIGDYNSYGFDSEYINMRIDSIIITFDDSFQVVHYREEVSTPFVKHYFPSDSRNIYKGENYILDKIRTKKKKVNYNRYYFTESDYEYAKH